MFRSGRKVRPVPAWGRKVFTLQTLPACDPEDQFGDPVGKVTGFSPHAGVAAKAHERKKHHGYRK